MAPLQVVCLISGGKDSLFSILHCIQNGHDVVALANLHPPQTDRQDAVEDLDSYMYQTIGHKIIPLYEKALGLPLYRQEITGTAVNQSKSYCQTSPTSGPDEQEDETESLIPLLQKVKQHHPDINAVSTGAILSDYQRTRVESVALRLGFTPLSFLWQWPNIPPHTQTTLLKDMHAAGQDSRIIKVASGGLDNSFLWCNVAQARTMNRINNAIKRFGSGDDGAVLGEGGEYETLAVAGPAPLWKGSIGVRQDEMNAVAGEAGSASINISNARVEEVTTEREYAGVRTPPILEPRFETLVDKVASADATTVSAVSWNPDLRTLPDHVCFQYMTGPAGKSAAEQMAAIMDREALSAILQLQAPSLEFGGIAYVSIILRNMADFVSVNTVYSAAFSEANPPARVTLAEPSILEEGKDVMVSFTCVRGPAIGRHGLHVQSQSYWAPANIGPYSQAVSVPASPAEDGPAQRIVYIAGQIPLVPASMELAAPEAANGDLGAFAKQAVLAAQHFIRVGRAMQVGMWACGIAFITAGCAENAAKQANIARLVWQGVHLPQPSEDAEVEEAEDGTFDVWNVTHGAQRSVGRQQQVSKIRSTYSHDGLRESPPLEVIWVEALPRGASIEWATYGLTTYEESVPRIPHFEHLLKVFDSRIVR